MSTEKPEIIIYKKLLARDLHLHVFRTEDTEKGPAPCVLLIHGGGWGQGTPAKYYPIAEELKSMGYTVACLQYRLIRQEQEPDNTVFDAVADAQDAFQFLIANADSLEIDPRRIVLCGGSAGAHLAAGVAQFKHYGQSTVNPDIKPVALIFFNPVIDTSVDGYGNQSIGEKWEDISPLHKVKPGLPPTITFHGTADKTTPFKGAELFHQAMLKAGNESTLLPYENGDHGYYWQESVFPEVMKTIEQFSRKHRILN